MRDTSDTLIKLLMEQKKPRWNINFCPRCGSHLIEQRLNYAYDRDNGELCALALTINCKNCRSSIPLKLFAIEDIESNENGESDSLKSSLMEFKHHVASLLPEDWENKDPMRQEFRKFMSLK